MSKFPANDAKFDQVRALKLPFGEYAITSSGPLGIRGVRQIGDIDLVVSDVLWDRLANQYGTVVEGEITKIRIGDDIEILGEGSFMASRTHGPTIAQQIAEADNIDGLPFVSLRHILYFKEILGRTKDAADIAAIKEYQAREAE